VAVVRRDDEYDVVVSPRLLFRDWRVAHIGLNGGIAVTEGRRSSVDPRDEEPRITRGGEPGAIEERPVPAGEAAQRPPGQERRVVQRTRASALWTAVAIGLVALAGILIFVAQNSAKVRIHFLMMDGSMPLGVALLVAALLGGLLMLAIGTIRILQLRRLARRPELVDRRRRR
jgi:uncharacterized integral membrane protein